MTASNQNQILEGLQRLDAQLSSLLTQCQEFNAGMEEARKIATTTDAQMQELARGVQEVQTSFEQNNTQVKQLLKTAENMHASLAARAH